MCYIFNYRVYYSSKATISVIFKEAGRSFAILANGEYPVNPNLTPSDLVASWGTFTPDDTPLAKIAKLRPASLKITEIVAFDE